MLRCRHMRFNVWCVPDRGVMYEFRISAQNAVDFGEEAVKIIKTPDGSEWLGRMNERTNEGCP